MLFSSHLWSSFPEVTSIKKHSKLIEKQDREQLEIAEVDSRVPAPIDTNSGCRHRPSASTHSFNATCRQHLITTANISNSKWRGYFVLHRKHLVFVNFPLFNDFGMRNFTEITKNYVEVGSLLVSPPGSLPASA